MGPFELIEKLINEHGSAAVLREQLGLVKAQQTALERERDDLKAKNAQQRAEIDQHQLRLQALEATVRALQSGPLASVVCSHCGGSALRRVGTRPHPVFGQIGLREAVLRCEACAGITHIELSMPK